MAAHDSDQVLWNLCYAREARPPLIQALSIVPRLVDILYRRIRVVISKVPLHRRRSLLVHSNQHCPRTRLLFTTLATLRQLNARPVRQLQIAPLWTYPYLELLLRLVDLNRRRRDGTQCAHRAVIHLPIA